MTQLVITLKDQSYLPNIRRIVKSLVGVEKVSTPKSAVKPKARKKCLSRYERSLLDAKEGRVYSYESSEEFFKKMGTPLGRICRSASKAKRTGDMERQIEKLELYIKENSKSY